MPEEKTDQEIVVNKKDELSEQDLDQASGGFVVHHQHDSERPESERRNPIQRL